LLEKKWRFIVLDIENIMENFTYSYLQLEILTDYIKQVCFRMKCQLSQIESQTAKLNKFISTTLGGILARKND